ncbi:helix-turn-helix domain-containing protein [Bacteroidales bacterium OttesenSCG-928-M06]|nr:helix-turn-helix domain-containing protein [Bacteroidales bacterium OttesenSCG-928-M06]
MPKLFVTKHLFIAPEHNILTANPIIPSVKNYSLIFFESDYSNRDHLFLPELSSIDKQKYPDLLISLDREYSSSWTRKTAINYIMKNQTTFFKEFKEVTGSTFANYLTALRVYKMIYLLINSTTPIEQIAYECGIATTSNYRKIIREYCGMSPSEVRKMWR